MIICGLKKNSCFDIKPNKKQANIKNKDKQSIRSRQIYKKGKIETEK